MEYYGYAGATLWVNLTTGEIKKESLDLELAQKFVGSSGFNSRLAYELMKSHTDPFAPHNPILIGAGPLIGTLAPNGKITAVVRFPNPAGEDPSFCYIGAAIGGSRHFGLMLKNAGYDSVIITGKAQKPVFIKIFDDDVEICDAIDLWGKKDTYETTDELVGKYMRCGVIAIGKAGENLVKTAMAIVDNNSTFGRNGLGAVMGSKNLKAIVVRGTKGVRIADPKRFLKNVRELHDIVAKSPLTKGFQEYGLHGGSFPWDTWKRLLNPGRWPTEKWDNFYGLEKCHEAIKRLSACTGCPFSCRGTYDITGGRFSGQETRTGHFVHFASYGQVFDDVDWRNMAKLVDVCNRSGMSAVETLTMVSFLTGLFTRGTITTEHTDGLILSNDIDSHFNFLNKIIDREGFGNVVADGWFAVSKKIGLDLTKMLGIIKGGACIYDARAVGWDPRIFNMMVNPRGGHHTQAHWVTSLPRQPIDLIKKGARSMGMTDQEIDRSFSSNDFNVGRLTKHTQDNGMVLDSLGSCNIWGMFQFAYLNRFAELYSAATGIDIGTTELKRNGERAFNMLKLLNVREGFRRKDDVAPDMWFRPRKIYSGEKEVVKDYYRRKVITQDDVEKTLDDYYDERGWDVKTGIPTVTKLTELGLQEFINVLSN